MKSGRVRLALLLAVLLAPMAYAQAGTLRGTVKNGTTGKPASSIKVILIQLQGGMEPVGTTQSDANGQFTFDNPSVGAQPMLVRAVYNGINFHQPVPPGTSSVEVDIFEPSKNSSTIEVPSHVVIFQPNGATLIVGEEYSIENNSHPPLAYFRADGNFEFALPEKAQLQQVAAAGPAGMPVVQAPIEKNNNHYLIAYAFRPGQNMVRYSYELPYQGNAATVKIPTIYPKVRLLVVAPPTVQISGAGLQPGGQEQGMNIYGGANLTVGSLLTINVSGTAPDASAGGESARSQGRDGQQGGGEAPGVNIQQVPGRLDVLKWPLVAGFVGVFALGAILLARKPVAVVTTSANATDYIASTTSKKPKSGTASSAPPASPETKSATMLPGAPAEVDTGVAASLDALKEQFFRLELRRQAGTISEEEYVSQRASAEKVLRELVRD